MVEPETDNDMRFRQLVRDILDQVEQGIEQFTTTDAVIAEVVFILTSPRHYGLTRREALIRVVPLLRFRGSMISNRKELESAFSRWEANPKISFVDALSIAMAKEREYELVTFDTAMADAAGIPRWDRTSTRRDDSEEKQ